MERTGAGMNVWMGRAVYIQRAALGNLILTQSLTPMSCKSRHKGHCRSGLVQSREGLMAGTDKRKQSLYFPEDMLREIQEEANRQDRSLSWIVQQAWKIARNEIMRFPSVNDVIGGGGNTEERE